MLGLPGLPGRCPTQNGIGKKKGRHGKKEKKEKIRGNGGNAKTKREERDRNIDRKIQVIYIKKARSMKIGRANLNKTPVNEFTNQ